MNAYEELLSKSKVCIPGLLLESLEEELDKLLKSDNDILAIYAFECHEEDGFANDSTSIYIVWRWSNFRPYCPCAMKTWYSYRLDDEQKYKMLKKVDVLPMTKEEKAELDYIKARV